MQCLIVSATLTLAIRQNLTVGQRQYAVIYDYSTHVIFVYLYVCLAVNINKLH